MFFVVQNIMPSGTSPVPLTCPQCGKEGTFETIQNVPDLYIMGKYNLGQRMCPNRKCRTHVFIVIQRDEVLISYPAQRIDFDTTDIPNNVVKTLDEAISCHANQLFISSAIMIRRTLEEICENKEANGSNLKDRIKKLSGKIIIPLELLTGMDELRILGNDAAHIEAKVYQDIGQRELEIAIKFTKEILKAVYQYSALLKELQSLKETTQQVQYNNQFPQL